MKYKGNKFPTLIFMKLARFDNNLHDNQNMDSAICYIHSVF